MRSCWVVRASQLSWVRSEHPRHSGIWGAADEAVLNIAHEKKNQKNPPLTLKVEDADRCCCHGNLSLWFLVLQQFLTFSFCWAKIFSFNPSRREGKNIYTVCILFTLENREGQQNNIHNLFTWPYIPVDTQIECRYIILVYLLKLCIFHWGSEHDVLCSVVK